MVVKNIDYFDAEKIMNSGQIFRMYKLRENLFSVFSMDKGLVFSQEGNRVVFDCTEEEFEGYWKHYFDLDRDYGKMVRLVLAENGAENEAGLDKENQQIEASINADRDASFLINACRYGANIRILNQNIWEMMISFIISQQKQIPSIRKCIEALCERFGEKRSLKVAEEFGCENAPDFYYTFPTAEAIAKAGPEGLKGLSLGYRERYIYETSVAYLTKGIPDESLKTMSFENAKKYLCSFCGIGEKVANCICLFGAGFVDAFPIDVHIKQILYREYGDKSVPFEKLKQSDFEQLIEDNFGRYAGFKGIVQQWIFAYELVK